MDVNSLTSVLDTVYYSEGFLQLIEDHMPVLRAGSNIQAVSVSSQDCYAYNGDFYGLLAEYHVERKYHLIVTRFNGYKASTDFMKNIEYFLLPDLASIEEMKMLYLTKS